MGESGESEKSIENDSKFKFNTQLLHSIKNNYNHGEEIDEVSMVNQSPISAEYFPRMGLLITKDWLLEKARLFRVLSKNMEDLGMHEKSVNKLEKFWCSYGYCID